MDEGKFEKAIMVYEIAQNLGKINEKEYFFGYPDLLYLNHKLCSQLSDKNNSSGKTISQRIENHKIARIQFDLGVKFENLRKFDEAEKKYRNAIRLYPNNAKFHNKFGLLLQNMKRFTEAEIEFRSVIRIEKYDFEAFLNLGNVLKNMKRFNEAENEYRKAIRLYPNNYVIHFKLGILLQGMRNFDEAMKEFQQVIKIEPEFKKITQPLIDECKIQALIDEATGEDVD